MYIVHQATFPHVLVPQSSSVNYSGGSSSNNCPGLLHIQLYCTGLIQNPTTDMSYHAITFMFFVYVTVGMIPHAYAVLS